MRTVPRGCRAGGCRLTKSSGNAGTEETRQCGLASWRGVTSWRLVIGLMRVGAQVSTVGFRRGCMRRGRRL
jgi:hypothetical protein